MKVHSRAASESLDLVLRDILTDPLEILRSKTSRVQR